MLRVVYPQNAQEDIEETVLGQLRHYLADHMSRQFRLESVEDAANLLVDLAHFRTKLQRFLYKGE